MISIEKPDDIISISLYNILTYRKDEDYFDLIKDWNRSIFFEIEQFYPVIVEFLDGKINFIRDVSNIKPDLKIRMSLQTLLDLAYGRINPIKAFLTRKLKAKGFYKLGTLKTFMKIFFDTIQMMANNPNDKYYKHSTSSEVFKCD